MARFGGTERRVNDEEKWWYWRERAERVVDDWDLEEGQSLRDGYRQSLERLILAALEEAFAAGQGAK